MGLPERRGVEKERRGAECQYVHQSLYGGAVLKRTTIWQLGLGEGCSRGCRRETRGALFGGLDVCGGVSGVQGLEEAEEAGRLADAAELDAEGLDLDEEVLDVDDLVPDQGLEEHTHQAHQAVLEGRGHHKRMLHTYIIEHKQTR